MKNVIFVMLVLAASAAAQTGGGYTITQSVIASGGGQSSATGTYSVTGTIGQAVAGQPATGAPYNVFAGFWTPQALDPSAGGVSVSGRVTTASGVGIRNVRVTLTSAGGESRTAITRAGGAFSFADVPAGETYIISVSAKRYEFAQSTQVYSVTGEVTDILFIANFGAGAPPM